MKALLVTLGCWLSSLRTKRLWSRVILRIWPGFRHA